MLKHTWKLIGLVLICIFAFVWLVKAPIMAAYLTEKLGVQISLRRISMWPSSTTMRYFKIANPPGFKSRSAFDVENAQIDYRWKALTHTPTEIDRITLENIILNIEILNGSASNNNWAAIGAQMPSKKSEREVVIHKLVLKNMIVETDGPGAKKLGVQGRRQFDYMEFDSINSKDGFPTKELISRIFQGAGIRKYIENLLNPAKEIEKALNPLKIFGENEAPENHLEGA
jgi:hypothetical protein